MRAKDWNHIENLFREKLRKSYIDGLTKGSCSLALSILEDIKNGKQIPDIQSRCELVMKRGERHL